MRVAILRVERINVFLREKEMAEIEHLEICLQEFFRNLVVQLLPGVMTLLQEAAHGHRDRFARTRRRRRCRDQGCKKDCAKGK